MTTLSAPRLPTQDVGPALLAPLAPEVVAAVAAAHGVEVTPELFQEIDLQLIGVPKDEQADCLNSLFSGPAADCRSCTHPDAGLVDHDFVDGAWWHDIAIGETPVVRNDLGDVEAHSLPFQVGIMRHLNSPAGVFLCSKGWGDLLELDLAGVRQALRVLTVAERLLSIEDTEGQR